jgi:3-hydroxyisobutyrate dehydrogenase-like beta-hydroxyacid dehydrogenase
MSHLSLIGLGAMGGALAHAFLGAGHQLTVWNRSPQKMTPIVQAGAKGADSLLEAVEASPIIVVCIDNYAATESVLEQGGAISALSGRTLIQLSTGTPQEARNAEIRVREAGAAYIDGAIMPYPEGIGRADARLLFAGPKDAYERSRAYLTCLGGDLRYLGENVTAAAVLDMAWLTYELCGYLAALHGANLCESEDVGVASLADVFPDGSPPRRLATVIESGDFADPGASLTVWDAALERVQAQANEAGINSEIPDLISSLFKRAIASGYGDEDVAAVIKVLRTDGAVPS